MNSDPPRDIPGADDADGADDICPDCGGRMSDHAGSPHQGRQWPTRDRIIQMYAQRYHAATLLFSSGSSMAGDALMEAESFSAMYELNNEEIVDWQQRGGMPTQPAQSHSDIAETSARDKQKKPQPPDPEGNLLRRLWRNTFAEPAQEKPQYKETDDDHDANPGPE